MLLFISFTILWTFFSNKLFILRNLRYKWDLFWNMLIKENLRKSHSDYSREIRKVRKKITQFTLNPYYPESFKKKIVKIKINRNFYFCFSLWCLKMFYEDLEGLYGTFWGGTAKKCQNKKFKLIFPFNPGSGWEGLKLGKFRDFLFWILVATLNKGLSYLV